VSDIGRVSVYSTVESGEVTEHVVGEIPKDIFDKSMGQHIWSERTGDAVFIHVGSVTIHLFPDA